ncbi:N-acetyltransferase [Pseudomonas sp. Irchel 3E20]|uniref:GNAT family N-acetyltransferase n=1 Tax=Pseudomonas sp. Irchel 3E20 TaxID=2008983 RepID=UPI000BA44B5F|nr:GNAT family N-acetyltransferase [Pseudomonas sp. Irchel 3E20]
MRMRIERLDQPTDQDRLAILNPLLAYSESKVNNPYFQNFALVVRDEHSDEILGGLYAKISYQWLYVELLSVPEQARGQGVGTRLMHMVEELAREKDCTGIWLGTFDFQAPQFYKKLGFTQYGQIDDYPPGHRQHFFQKRLKP